MRGGKTGDNLPSGENVRDAGTPAGRRRGSSVFFEASHPFGPVGGGDAAAEGPATAGVELLVPLERPEFLDADRADRPVEEQMIVRAVVAVDAEVLHLVAGAEPLPIELGRIDSIVFVV